MSGMNMGVAEVIIMPGPFAFGCQGVLLMMQIIAILVIFP